jgi:hypothetical protein
MYDGCYKRSFQPLSWIDASVAALQQNASLASIHSEAQNRWLAEHLRCQGWLNESEGSLWFGLNQISESGVWRHVDGSPAPFATWSTPTTSAVANCAAFGIHSSWSMEQCDTTRHSLLKWNESAQCPEGGCL